MNEVDLGMVILRVVGGITLALHGLNKFRGGLSGVAGWFDSIGMKPGRFNATMAASSETFGGLALALGVLTPFAALAIVGTMTVAAWVEHRGHFFILDNGWEYTMIIALIAVVVATVGPGEWSIDGALGIHDDLNGWVGLAIALGGGLAAAAAHLALFYRPPQTAQA
jgi:putative oxidoreductase